MLYVPFNKWSLSNLCFAEWSKGWYRTLRQAQRTRHPEFVERRLKISYLNNICPYPYFYSLIKTKMQHSAWTEALHFVFICITKRAVLSYWLILPASYIVVNSLFLRYFLYRPYFIIIQKQMQLLFSIMTNGVNYKLFNHLSFSLKIQSPVWPAFIKVVSYIPE